MSTWRHTIHTEIKKIKRRAALVSDRTDTHDQHKSLNPAWMKAHVHSSLCRTSALYILEHSSTYFKQVTIPHVDFYGIEHTVVYTHIWVLFHCTRCCDMKHTLLAPFPEVWCFWNPYEWAAAQHSCPIRNWHVSPRQLLTAVTATRERIIVCSIIVLQTVGHQMPNWADITHFHLHTSHSQTASKL